MCVVWGARGPGDGVRSHWGTGSLPGRFRPRIYLLVSGKVLQKGREFRLKDGECCLYPYRLSGAVIESNPESPGGKVSGEDSAT